MFHGTSPSELDAHLGEVQSRNGAIYAAAERAILGELDPVETLFAITGLARQVETHLRAVV